MKVTKYRVDISIKGRRIRSCYEPTEKEARQLEEISNGYLSYEYIGEEVIELKCENCDKDLFIGADYIKVDEHTRYCIDCVQTVTTTSYYVGGEYVGDDDDVYEYSLSETEQ